jgi:hypothetical protein
MSPSTTKRAAPFFAALIASACRFGGPSGDPTLLVVADAGGVDAGGGQGGQTGSGGPAGSGGIAGTGGGTGSGGAGGTTADASDDVADDTTSEGGFDGDVGLVDVRAEADAVPDGGSFDSGPPTGCAPPFTSAVCDPVCNAGCPSLFRCDITGTPRTGVCVGTLLSTAAEGMACTRSLATDDCVERLSCVEGACRRLCYRDTDCTTTGTCCTTAIDFDAGPSGYKICGPCMP